MWRHLTKKHATMVYATNTLVMLYLVTRLLSTPPFDIGSHVEKLSWSSLCVTNNVSQSKLFYMGTTTEERVGNKVGTVNLFPYAEVTDVHMSPWSKRPKQSFWIVSRQHYG